MRQADFRSDTLTQPSAAMRTAMAAADVGDDVLDGDPTVKALEAEGAAWLGMEEALFVPSGTMANQVALGAWTQPGDEVIVQRWAHIPTFEAGAAGALHGLQTVTLGGLDGRMAPEEVRAALRPDFIHCPQTALISLEQTHNYAGGRVLPLEEVQAISGIAREVGVPLHLDGARLANAVVASGVAAREWCACADSVSLCLSKGLGAPVGSLIAGSHGFVQKARLVRKRLGGWMRQAGIIAEAGRMALAEGVERLGDDHALARGLAERVAEVDGMAVDLSTVETNMALVAVECEGWDAAGLAAELAKHGVRVMPMGESLRFVTHLDVGDDDVDQLIVALGQILG